MFIFTLKGRHSNIFSEYKNIQIKYAIRPTLYQITIQLICIAR